MSKDWKRKRSTDLLEPPPNSRPSKTQRTPSNRSATLAETQALLFSETGNAPSNVQSQTTQSATTSTSQPRPSTLPLSKPEDTHSDPPSDLVVERDEKGVNKRSEYTQSAANPETPTPRTPPGYLPPSISSVGPIAIRRPGDKRVPGLRTEESGASRVSETTTLVGGQQDGTGNEGGNGLKRRDSDETDEGVGEGCCFCEFIRDWSRNLDRSAE